MIEKHEVSALRYNQTKKFCEVSPLRGRHSYFDMKSAKTILPTQFFDEVAKVQKNMYILPDW